MDCPKCGAFQPAADAQECASCGVVFARFREAQERALLARNSVPQQVVPVEDETSIAVPRALVVAALVLFIGFGILWTAKRRQDRAKADAKAAGSAMLDEINNRGLQERRRLEAESQRARTTRESSAPKFADVTQPKRPEDFSEEEAKQLLEKCTGFTELQTIRLPKTYPQYSRDYTIGEYPALEAAERDRVVSVHSLDSVSTVTIPPHTHARMNITETADHYVVNLGRRQIVGMHDLTGSGGEASMRFDFVYAQRVAAETLLSATENFYGHAYFVRQGGAWRVTRAEAKKKDGATVVLCR